MLQEIRNSLCQFVSHRSKTVYPFLYQYFLITRWQVTMMFLVLNFVRNVVDTNGAASYKKMNWRNCPLKQRAKEANQGIKNGLDEKTHKERIGRREERVGT